MAKIRVVVVDDSALIRSGGSLTASPTCNAGWQPTRWPHASGRTSNPDVITLDVEMPRGRHRLLAKLMRLRPTRW
jgi:chemotaxis response regulator CheB